MDRHRRHISFRCFATWQTGASRQPRFSPVFVTPAGTPGTTTCAHSRSQTWNS
ncbi:protein YoaL [Trabulsiella odontotermitis]|uniref:protein YoaL n=1 Tax=Trabulsiella odontotermitis TaxID=379893 RepID=UPI003AC8A678